MTQRIRNFSKHCIKYKSKASNNKRELQTLHSSQCALFEMMLLFIFSKLCNLNSKLNSGKKKSTMTDYHNHDHRPLNQKSLELEKV